MMGQTLFPPLVPVTRTQILRSARFEINQSQSGTDGAEIKKLKLFKMELG